MNQVICPRCGRLITSDGPISGQTLVCPDCAATWQPPDDLDASSGSPWSNPAEGVSRWPFDPAADYRHRSEAEHIPQADAGEDAAELSVGRRVMIYGLLAVSVFMVGLIGVVLLARQLRPAVARRGLPPRPETLGQWIGQLERGPSKEARREAAETIAGMGPPAVIAALDATTEVSEDGNTLSISPAVVRAMAGLRPAPVDALGNALGSEKQNVRVAAAGILREMGPEAKGAVEALAAALDDQNRWARWFAAEALGKIGPDARPALDALLVLVKHPDRRTRRRVVTAIGSIGPAAKAARPVLAKVCEEDRDRAVRKAARMALYQVNLAEIAAEAASRADQQVQALIKQLQAEDEHTGVAAAKSLGRLGSQAREAIPALAQTLDHENKWLREAAACALGAMGRDAADIVPFLEKLLDDTEPEVRTAAKKALEKIVR